MLTRSVFGASSLGTGHLRVNTELVKVGYPGLSCTPCCARCGRLDLHGWLTPVTLPPPLGGGRAGRTGCREGVHSKSKQGFGIDKER